MSQTWFITSSDNWVPSTFSLVPSYIVSEPNPNLGTSAVIITSDPLRDIAVVSGETMTGDEVELAKSRIRRRVMAEFTTEYATLHRDLLRELAR